MNPSFPSSTIQQAAALLLGYAIKEVFPDALLGEYRITDIGFSYDFAADQPLSEQLFPLIEEKMRSITKEDITIRWTEMMRENAIQLFEHNQQDLQADLISEYPDKIIPIMQMGSHYDIGGDLPFDTSLGFPCVKLITIDQNDFNLWTLHGIGAEDKQSLKYLIKQLDSYQKYNAKTLAKEMRLIAEDSLWLPKGCLMRQLVVEPLIQNLKNQHYQPVQTPPSQDLDSLWWKHAQLFLDESDHAHHFPIKFMEIATILPETSQDIETIFCNLKQLHEQMISSLQFMDKTIKIMGFKNQWYLNLHYRKSLGSHQNWKKCVNLLEQALKESALDYQIDKEETAFQGPTIEMKIIDPLGRQWTGPFLSLNIHTMERLLENSPSSKDFFMITQSCLGPIERCIDLMLEQHRGKVPFRFVPEQVRIILVSEKKLNYAKSVQESIEKAGFRVSLDIRPGKLSGKIHSAELERIPFVVLIGEQEEIKNTLTIRSCYQEGNDKVKVDDFIPYVLGLIPTAVYNPINSLNLQ